MNSTGGQDALWVFLKETEIEPLDLHALVEGFLGQEHKDGFTGHLILLTRRGYNDS